MQAIITKRVDGVEVFENGMFFMNINMKSPTKAKQFLKQWLVS